MVAELGEHGQAARQLRRLLRPPFLPAGAGRCGARAARYRVRVLSTIGRLYIQRGDVRAAEALFTRVAAERESLPGAARDEADAAAATAGGGPAMPPDFVESLNHALLMFGQRNNAAAVAEFEGILRSFAEAEADAGAAAAAAAAGGPAGRLWNEGMVAAANNAATCALHSGDLRKAIGVLEDLVRSNPATRMHPVLIFNLATLYDLAHGAASARRKKEVLQRVAAIYRAPRLTKPADFRI